MRNVRFLLRPFRRTRRAASSETDRDQSPSRLLADIRHQGHEASPLDSLRHRVLARCRAARLATTDDPTVPIHKLAQEFDVLVVNVHRTWTLAVHEKRISLLDLGLHARSLASEFFACRGSS
jgi:hypothetical protein